MNPIETTGNDFTRRDFMKKSALTVGAITLLGAGVGLAADLSGSSWWDMKCTDPGALLAEDSDTVTITGIAGFFSADIRLAVLSTYVADPDGDPGYNLKSYSHYFSLGVDDGVHADSLIGHNKFDSICDTNTGAITTYYSASDSVPMSSASLSKQTILGDYTVDLTIIIAHVQSGLGAETTVTGLVAWVNSKNQNDSGSESIPGPNGDPVKIATNFKSTNHS